MLKIQILPLKPSTTCLEIDLLSASKSTKSRWPETRCSGITSSHCLSDYTSEERSEGSINYYGLFCGRDQHLAEVEKRTIHDSIRDAKLDPSLKSPNAQLQCQARVKESAPRKRCSGELSRNRQSTLTVKPCKSSLKNWGKSSFKSSRAAVLISEDTGLLASSFIFTERESFLTQRELGSFCCWYLCHQQR